MSAFAAWGITLLGLAVITTLFELLLPQGKTRNVIRSVIATVAVSVIVAPLPGLIRQGSFSFDFSGEVQTDGEYIEYVEGIKRNAVERSAAEYLKQNGIEGAEVSVTLDGFKVVSAAVNFSSNGITAGGGHINKSVVVRLLAEYFGIGEEAVMAYG